MIESRAVFEAHCPLSAKVGRSAEPVPFSERMNLEYRDIAKGEAWGHDFDCAWFHITGRIPAEWAGSCVALHLDLNGESCVFDNDGTPVYGMTNGSVFGGDSSKSIHRFLTSCKGNEKIDFWVEAGANGLFGLNCEEDPAADSPKRHGSYEGRVVDLELVKFNVEMWHLVQDLRVVSSLVDGYGDKNTPRRNSAIRIANRAVDAYADNPANAGKVRAILKEALEVPANPADLNVTAVGHAHIDTGWLWPVRETVRKCGRTYASQIKLIEEYPDYVFGASQPQHYQMVKDHYPKLYEKIRKTVKDGRWECQGGMWVEADCNIISGESMVRQFLHGKNFFMDEFGVDVRNLWIPDVFGYSAAMPQIMKLCGVDYFITQKISWSEFNKFPHNTFMWQGIDGSRVLTHFPPENNYNSPALPGPHIHAQEQFKENDFMHEYLALFGIGDGGGGPREEHVETSLRMANLNGAPKVKFGRACDFLERASQHADELETWVGELYLELHRGTLTTQSRTKRGNRRLEKRLRDVEMVWSALPLEQYPAAELDRLWKVLLINQFHDIIPGSSINRVYREAEAQYAGSLAECDALIERAAGSLLNAEEDTLTLLNTLNIDYTGPAMLPGSWSGCAVVDADGNELPSQPAGDGIAVQARLPASSFTVLRKGDGAAAGTETLNSLALENELIRYEFTKDGTITSIFDKEVGREIVPDGAKGNLLSLYVDRPTCWDAWDVQTHYMNELLENASATAKPGAVFGVVYSEIALELSIGGSSIRQKARLPKNSKRIDFETRVDWHEQHKMLRVSFPTVVRSEHATYDIQYGYITRNTHANTSWDYAKFEVGAQRYADLSGRDYGVALLNNCKYGHRITDGVLDLNLLRSPRHPDPDADQGAHEFTYSLLPHTGRMIDSNVQAEASMLNRAPVVMKGSARKSAALPVAVQGDGISLEVLKKAEKDDAIILRVVETQGRHSKGAIAFNRKFDTIAVTNLMEWEDEEAVPCAGELEITLKPFEIRTYEIMCRP